MLLSTLLFVASSAQLPRPQGDGQDPTRAAVRVTNGLAVDLYRALTGAERNTNMCLSPYSIAIACMMAAEGARDETAIEMKGALHCPLTDELTPVHASFAALAKRLREGAGDPSPDLPAKIDSLRRQLEEQNSRASDLLRDDHAAAGKAVREANRLADELNQLLPRVGRYDLRVTNALWVERTFQLLPDYATAVDRWYGSGGVRALDIAGDAEAARQQINGFVEKNTNGRIKDLIPAGCVSSNTRLVITNAVWFLGEWAEPFLVDRTRDQDFLMAGSQRATVQLMRDQAREAVPYAAFTGKGKLFATPESVPADPAKKAELPALYPDEAGFTMVELPYKGGELAMVVLAPRTADGLPHLESMLTAAALTDWLGQMRPRTVDLALPRFKVTASAELGTTLRDLGMRRAFISPGEPNAAQFGGISDATDPTRQLFISRVLHKAWVEVDEKGTEAAAATALSMSVGANIPAMVPFIPVFRADRPFLFLIRDRHSGAILFLGRHVDPRI